MTATNTQFTQLPCKMTESEFLEVFGGVYEHSPWIAKAAFETGLNACHDSPADLSELMKEVVAKADHEKILTLINAHPDLAGKAAVDGELTDESTSEQSGAGIDQCNPEEFKKFQSFNNAYKDKFGFPFIMAVKGSNRHLILEAFEKRIKNNEEAEFNQAVEEINKIARFRLDAIAEN